MGDMADYVNEQIELEYEFRHQWRSGQLSHEEAYDLGVIDEQGSEYGTERLLKTCRCCGKSGLTWGSHKGKWLLFDGNDLHACPVNPLSLG